MMTSSKAIVAVLLVTLINSCLSMSEEGFAKELEVDMTRVAELTAGTEMLKALNATLFEGDENEEERSLPSVSNQSPYGSLIGHENVNYTSSIRNDGDERSKPDDCWTMVSLALTVLASVTLMVLIFVYLFFTCSQQFSKNKHSVVIQNVPTPALQSLPRKVR